MNVFRYLLLHLLVKVCCGHGLHERSSPMQGVNTTTTQEPCKREFLISVEARGSETWITSFSKSNNVNQDSNSMLPEVQTSTGPKKLSGQISQGCGDNYFRCKNLLVEATLSKVTMETLYILFIPLEDRVHLIELSVSNDSTVQFGADYGISQSTLTCSPSTIFKVGDSVFYTACINFEENSVALYEIRLNKTALSQSYMLPRPVAGEYRFQASQNNIANASNFLYMEWNYDTYILFAINNTLYSMRPSEGSIDDNYQPIGASCKNVYELALTGNDGEILAYCDRHLVYYSIDFADWTLQDTYDNAGRRYICPDNGLLLSVFRDAHYITYNVDDLMQDVTVSNSILSGVCYGSTNHSFFAYIEQQKGLFVLDTLTANVYPIATMSCDELNVNCTLLVAENRYMIVQSTDGGGGGTVWVRDARRNMSVIVEAQHTAPDLLTLIVDTNLQCSLTESNTENPVTKSTEGDQKANLRTAAVYSLVPVIALILVGVGVMSAMIIGVIIYRQHRLVSMQDLSDENETPDPPTTTYHSTYTVNNLSSIITSAEQHIIRITPVEEVITPTEEVNPRGANTIQVGNGDSSNLEKLSTSKASTPVQETAGVTLINASDSESQSESNDMDTEPLLHNIN